MARRGAGDATGAPRMSEIIDNYHDAQLAGLFGLFETRAGMLLGHLLEALRLGGRFEDRAHVSHQLCLQL